MSGIVQETPFDELYNKVHDAAKNRDMFLENFSSQMSKMLSVMDQMKKGAVIERIHNSLKGVTPDLAPNGVGELEKKGRDLEDRERKLIVEFNKVLSNLYLLPGYVLAVSTGVAGLLSSDPHICGLFLCVILVILAFLAALWFPVIFAHRQLETLLLKYDGLSSERKELHESFGRAIAGLPLSVRTDVVAGVATATAGGRNADSAARKYLTTFEEVNLELEFQAYYYKKFLWLISFCGLLYAVMLFVAGYCVLCDCNAFSFRSIIADLWLLAPYL